MARSLIIQSYGKGPHKRGFIAALCRAAYKRGLKAVAFAPQCQADNILVIGNQALARSEWTQALAAHWPPSAALAPVLLKKRLKKRAEFLAKGRQYLYPAMEANKAEITQLLDYVFACYEELKAKADIIFIAGQDFTPRAHPYANFIHQAFVQKYKAPVVFLANKPSHVKFAEQKPDSVIFYHYVPARGLAFAQDNIKIPKGRGRKRHFIAEFHKLAIYDYADFYRFHSANNIGKIASKRPDKCKIAVPIAPNIANFDDMDPLRYESEVEITTVLPGQAIPQDSDAILLLGSKNTIADLQVFYHEKWVEQIRELHKRGCVIMGICGGYQMLGQAIEDPDGFEGDCPHIDGIGLLDITTSMEEGRILRDVKGYCDFYASPISGYEIHLGRSYGPQRQRFMVKTPQRTDGAVAPCGRVWGTYLHGIFYDDNFRQQLLSALGVNSHIENFEAFLHDALDKAAEQLEEMVDIDALLAL